MPPVSEKIKEEIPRAAREAAEVGAPGYRTGLLAVAVIVLGAGVLALLIYLLMMLIIPADPRQSKVRETSPPAVQAPSALQSGQPLPVTPAK